jgi:hypothetical protein
MKKIFLPLVIIMGGGICVNAQQAYNDEMKLVNAVFQLVENLPNTSEEEWLNNFLPSYYFLKSVDEGWLIQEFDGDNENTFIEFCKYVYDGYKQAQEEGIVWNNIRGEPDKPDLRFKGVIIGYRMWIPVTFSNGMTGRIEFAYFEYKGKYYLLCLS